MTGAQQIARDRLVKDLRTAGITDDQALAAIGNVPREKFVAPAFTSQAYHNTALPIGEQQTISQPLVVAQMTQALKLNPTHRVLEIGTGCGYQTSILCQLARRVFSIERHASLAQGAEKRLHSLRYHNFITKTGDGSLGWPEQAPFDRIIVTAASPIVPRVLLDQLPPGGILVAPIGHVGEDAQKLMRYTAQEDGTITEEFLGDVYFVPLVGAHGVKTA